MPNILAARIDDKKRNPDDPEVKAYMDRKNDFPEGSTYEAIRVHNRTPHNMPWHRNRADSSANITKLKRKHSIEKVEEMCYSVIEQVRDRTNFLLLVAFTPNHTAVIAYENNIDVADPEFSYKAMTYDVERPLPEAKSMMARKIAGAALSAAQDAQLHEALIVDKQGYIREGSVTSVWWQMGDEVFTNLDEALPGTTQSLILELAAAKGIAINTSSTLHKDQLAEINGLAVSSVRAGFRRVGEVDGVAVNDGGSFTPEMRQLFDLLLADIRKHCPPQHEAA